MRFELQTGILECRSLKRMTPLFFAFDRAHYEKILPHHFADLLNFPKNIMALSQVSLLAFEEAGVIALHWIKHMKCVSTKTLKVLLCRLLIHIYTRHHYSFHTE